MSTETVPGTRETRATAWSSAGLHRGQLDSGMWVKFRYPDLSMLAAAGKIPEHLKAIALLRIANELKLLLEVPEPAPDQPEPDPAVDEDKLRLNYELNNWLITQMVAALSEDGESWTPVELTPDQVEDPGFIPSEDRDMLLLLADRKIDVDARGVVMGVTPLSRYARFLHAHRRHELCGEDCPGCADLRGEERTLRDEQARLVEMSLRRAGVRSG